jgi:hypothetical protein
VRRSLALSLDAYVRERLVEGASLAMFAAANTTMADNWYLFRESLGLHEYAIDSVCAFDVFTHPRALKEDALYGAGDYKRKYRNLAHGIRPSPLDAYQEVIFGSAYAALASFVWGSKVHWDLLRGQHSQPPLTDHWYGRVWHDALLGWSIPGPWYEQIIVAKIWEVILAMKGSLIVNKVVTAPHVTINMDGGNISMDAKSLVWSALLSNAV